MQAAPSVLSTARGRSGGGRTPLLSSKSQTRVYGKNIANRRRSLLVIGARSSGKTSFLNFLRTSLALPAWKQRRQPPDDDFDNLNAHSALAFPTFTSHYVETEVESERIGVTLWDSEGLESNVVDIQIQDMTTFIESKFEDTFNEESKVARAPGIRDTHIHCVFLLLDPVRLDATIAANRKASEINGAKAKANSFVKGRSEALPSGLDENLDLNVLRGLKGKTTVVPVIAKADTITSAHMAHLKRAVWDSLKKNGLETLEALNPDDDDDDDDSDITSVNEGRNGHTNGFDEREEDAAKAEEDKFSVTSVLNSSSDSSSSFSANDFDLARPGKPGKPSPTRTPSSPTVPSSAPAEPPALPLSIISPDIYEPEVVGRKFPWGFADPMNAEHCDFVKLKETVFTDWKSDLREASRELWYEGWRTSRLNKKARRDGAFIGDMSTQIWTQ